MTAKEGIKYLLEKFPNPDEPIFILRGRDILAPLVVLQWGAAAEIAGVSEEKVCSSIAVSHAMRKWPTTRIPD